MRTTQTLDDDLAGLLKQRARELGIPFKEAVNRRIRAGIGEAIATRTHPAPKTMSHLIPSGSGRVSISTSSGSSPMSWRRRLSRKKSMILPDVNVLVHAHNADSALHDRARLWWV